MRLGRVPSASSRIFSTVEMMVFMACASMAATALAAMEITASLSFTDASASATPGMARRANRPLATLANATSWRQVEAMEFCVEGKRPVPEDFPQNPPVRID